MVEPLRIDELLRVLVHHRVEFVLVGGVAAILHGSPLTTEDLDVVYAVEPGNCRRLARALREMDAMYRDPAGRRISPDEGRLESLRLHLLDTRFGRLDLLRAIGAGSRYEDLLGRSRRMSVEEMEIRVLELDAIIESKEAAGRPKDLYQLPYLRQLSRESRGDVESSEAPDDEPEHG